MLIASLMYDFVKMVGNSKCLADDLCNNPLLKFDILLEESTGNILYHTAKYHGLEFKVYPSSRFQISGSLHKYYNNGIHNYDDFNLSKVQQVIEDLSTKFKIVPEKMRLENLEYGVNIETSFNVDRFLDELVVYKQTQFESMQTKSSWRGKIASLSQYRIKIYDKGAQFGLTKNLLRFEKKVIKMEHIRKEATYLANLLEHQFAVQCLSQLDISLVNTIIVSSMDFNLMSSSDTDLFQTCSNPRSWKNMTRMQRRRNKIKLESMMHRINTINFKEEIKSKITTKGNELMR